MTDRHLIVFAAILAAGRASRFGSTKLAAELDGVPLARKAVVTAAEACGNRLITVLGHDWPTVLGLLPSDSGFVVLNEDYEQGLGTSIAAAARACPEHADALLLLLADQPLVTAQHLQALIDSWSGAENEIVASSYAGTQGPPVLFARNALQELPKLTGDQGARELLHDCRFSVQTIQFEPAATDIDTPADLAAIT